MSDKLYTLIILLTIIILFFIVLYYSISKVSPFKFNTIEGFVDEDEYKMSCNQGLCGNFLNKDCKYKKGDIGTSMVGIDYERPVQNAGLKKNIGDMSLPDFYIMTAYNCCATNKFNSGNVDLCSLNNCLRFGVRCLDFAIYSRKNTMEPIIAYSNHTYKLDSGVIHENYYIKTSDNELSLSSAFELIAANSFNTNMPGFNDPIIINLRLKTESVDTMDKIADLIKKYFKMGRKGILPSSFGQSGAMGKDVMKTPIILLRQRVIIFVDSYGSKHRNSQKLFKLVNSSTDSYRIDNQNRSSYQSLSLTESTQQNSNELIYFNKTNITFVYPDKNSDKNNITENMFNYNKDHGVQMIAMSMQQMDPVLEYYITVLFKNSAFVLKPASLRMIPIIIDKPKKVNENDVSPADREVDLTGGNIKGIEIKQTV